MKNIRPNYRVAISQIPSYWTLRFNIRFYEEHKHSTYDTVIKENFNIFTVKLEIRDGMT